MGQIFTSSKANKKCNATNITFNLHQLASSLIKRRRDPIGNLSVPDIYNMTASLVQTQILIAENTHPGAACVLALANFLPTLHNLRKITIKTLCGDGRIMD